MDPQSLHLDVPVDEANLLAAVRRASGDPHVCLEGPPALINLRATVIAVRLRSTLPELNTLAVLRICDTVPTAIRQVTIMRHVGALGYPAPRVLLAGCPGDELGGAWLLTELVAEARRPERTVASLPNAARGLVAVWRRPALLADLSARLHAIEPGPLLSELSGNGSGLDWYRFLWERARMVRGPEADQVVEWLERHRPADSTLAVSHGDLHHDNIVRGPNGPQVIDWEIAALAPPARDVACTMLALLTSYCRVPAPVRPLASAMGRAMSRRFLRLYRARSPIELPDDELAWHRILYSLNRLFWARMASSEADSDDPAIRQEGEARNREVPLHIAIIREITGIDLTGELVPHTAVR